MADDRWWIDTTYSLFAVFYVLYASSDHHNEQSNATAHIVRIDSFFYHLHSCYAALAACSASAIATELLPQRAIAIAAVLIAAVLLILKNLSVAAETSVLLLGSLSPEPLRFDGVRS